MSYPTVLPPASKPLEKSLEQAAARVLDMPVPIRAVWSPRDCPTGHLPWLAWGLAITHWQTSWSLDRKREAVADAIPFHRRKGTRRAVEEVLARHHASFRVVEWWQANPPRTPRTFEVRAPAEIGADFLTSETADAIIRDVAAAKPLGAHFDFVHELNLQASTFLAGGAMAASLHRADYGAIHDTSRDWSLVLQTEDGEPIRAEAGDYLENA